jgi:3-hydroxybutyrate dehydrogenase
VRTPLVDKQIDDQARAHNLPRDEVITKVILERQPSKEFVKIEEVAALAVFLAGDAASGITGAPLSIDGGWLAQ